MGIGTPGIGRYFATGFAAATVTLALSLTATVSTTIQLVTSTLLVPLLGEEFEPWCEDRIAAIGQARLVGQIPDDNPLAVIFRELDHRDRRETDDRPRCAPDHHAGHRAAQLHQARQP